MNTANKISHTWGGTLHLRTPNGGEAWPKSEYTMEIALEPGDDEACVMEAMHSSLAKSVRVDLKRAAGDLLREPLADKLAEAAHTVIKHWDQGDLAAAIRELEDALEGYRKAWPKA